MSIELKYVIANVSDLAAAVAFWRDTVGLKLKFQTPEWAEFDTGATRLALQPASPANPAGTWQPGLRVPDLASKRAELAAHGIDIGAEPHEEHGFLLSLFTGPDGAKASLSGPAPKQQA
ncbi:MAG: VOC family protein [Proteobacteria bacterium]|nr:VOC family protein [Pseudomonadota bacterium]